MYKKDAGKHEDMMYENMNENMMYENHVPALKVP